MRVLMKCEGCGNYMWTIETPDPNDNVAKLRKYCRECIEKRINKPRTLRDIEDENPRPEKFYDSYDPEERAWRKTD